MGMEESVKIAQGEGHYSDIAIIELDLIGESVNKLDGQTLTRFDHVLSELSSGKFKAAVLISKKEKIFIAGADINEIKNIKSAEGFRHAVGVGQGVMNKIEDLSIPVIAAVHGACMGGGTEVILACDHRICTNDKSTRIGLPETKLGIIPGFGGCVRLPRLVGLPASLDIILAGKNVDSRKAKKIGLVDEVVHRENLLHKSLQVAKKAIADGANKRKKTFRGRNLVERFLHSFLGRGIVFKKARESVLKMSHGHYPAPLKAIEVIKKTYGMSNRSRAMCIESEGFCQVAVTDVSKNLINLFFMMEAVKKRKGIPGKEVRAHKISNMSVLGAGTMGGGIAYVAADKGIDVRLKDINNTALALGFKSASDIWQKKVKRRRLKKVEYKRKMGLISAGLNYAGFSNLDLVIEAIVEDLSIKKSVIAEAAKHCSSDCIMATNTSSLSVNEIALAHPHPENFVGLHFFNPVDKMPLVEVIRGEKTSDETVATVFNLAKRMGKTPVVVKDAPGFLVNRILIPYISESMHLLADGMSIEALDEYYVKEVGLPMGPHALMDEVGLDVCVKVLKMFKESFGDRVQISKAFLTLSQTQRLGKKNGKGFYKYNEKGVKSGVDHSVYSDMGLKEPTNPLTKKECLERGLFSMINEASLALLEDRIVESAEEVDLAMIMGIGFPPFRGGILRYADTMGASYISDQLEIYARKDGAIRFKPSQPLRNMAKTERKFYSSPGK